MISTRLKCDLQAQQELVQRLVASSYLNKSARLKEMFLYLCKRVLHDGVDDIRELEVGHHVFGRPLHYDTAADNIVRVHASLLRKRLSEYFEAEGRDEIFFVDIPRGNYAPAFQRRSSPQTQAPADGIELQITGLGTSVVEPNPATPAPAVHKPRAEWYSIPGLLCVVLAAVVAFLLIRDHAKQTVVPAGSVDSKLSVDQFWSQIFSEGKTAEVLLDDASIDFYQQATGRSIGLSQYFDRSYLQTVEQSTDAVKLDSDLVRSFMLRRQSSYSDAAIVWQLAQLAFARGSKAELQFARDFSFGQLKTGNVVLLGNSRSNPWVQPFENHLALRWKVDESNHGYYPVDTSATASEQNRFRARANVGENREGYAIVALLPNLTDTGNVLIISGTGGTATSAAVRFLSDSHSMSELRSRLQPRNGPSFPYFESLLRVEKGTGLPRQVTIVISRPPLNLATH